MSLLGLLFWLLVIVSVVVVAFQTNILVGAAVILWLVYVFDRARRQTWNSPSSP